MEDFQGSVERVRPLAERPLHLELRDGLCHVCDTLTGRSLITISADEPGNLELTGCIGGIIAYEFLPRPTVDVLIDPSMKQDPAITAAWLAAAAEPNA